MSLTKIGSIGINTGIQFAGVTTIATLNGSDAVLSVGGTVNFVSDVSIGGSVSIGGTLTYEDVTNIDAVGLITARDGIVVGSGITLSKDGDVFTTGISTFGGDVKTTAGNITVRQPAGTDAIIRINEATTTNAFNISQTATEARIQTSASQPLNIRGQSGSGSSSYLAFWTRDGERLRITSDGKVGIRTDDPKTILDIQQDIDNSTNYWLDAGKTVRIKNTHASGYASLGLMGGGTGSDNNAIVWGGQGSESLILANRQNERLRINTGGKVLIGDTTARAFDGGNNPLVQVSDNSSGQWARISSTTYIDSTIAGGLILAHSRNATVGSHTIVQDDDKLGSIFFEGSDGTQFARGAQIQAYVDGSPGTNDMPGRLVFSTSADGSDSPTDHWQINRSGILDALNSGAGIRFLQGHSVTPNDATVVSNSLNDYEEGTLDWEIHKADGLTSGTNSSGSQTVYQKIGSMVYIQGWIRTDGQTSTTGQNAIMTDASGNRAQLPFTPSATGALSVSHTRSFNNATTSTFCIGWESSNDDLYVHANQGNVYTPATDNVTLNNQTNVVITFSGSYHTND